MDTVSKLVRSRIMAAVPQRGNHTTETRFIQFLKASKLSGWRRNTKIFGKPDFAWPKNRIAVFVDGCFWHGCPKCCKAPSTNRAYWEAKFTRNRLRDHLVTVTLREQGWKVFRLRECDLQKERGSRLQKMLTMLSGLLNRQGATAVCSRRQNVQAPSRAASALPR